MNNPYFDKKIKSKKVVFITLTALFFLLIFLLNNIYPLYVDDWVYSFFFDGYQLNYNENLQQIGSLKDIFISQYYHYFGWGGRSVVHVVAQFLLFIKPIYRDILNTLAYILLVALIYYFCKGNKKCSNLYLYPAIFMLLFLFLPTFTQTVLWITGSANYMWGTLILMLFIYFYYKSYITETPDKDIVFSILLFLLGIIAGWTNENTVASVLFFLFLYLVYLKWEKKRIPTWMIFGFAGLCIGAAFMILAPGNFIRANLNSGTIDISFSHLIKSRIKNLVDIYISVYAIPLFSALFIGILYLHFRKRKDLIISKEAIASIVFFLMAHISIAIMLFVPYFPERATFFSVTLLIISVCIQWKNLPQKKTLNTIVLSCLLILFVARYYFRYDFILSFDKIMEERQILMEEEKKKGNFDIVFTKRIHFPKEFDSFDASPDTANWVNKTYLNYFGVKSVRLID